MNVCPVTLNIKLGDDALIDLFMVQWHTPVPERGNAPTQIPAQCVQQKREVLRQFRDWLLTQPAGNPTRPVFVIIPELSMPSSELSLIEELVQAMQRPIVVIAGMEYQQWTEFQQLVPALPDMPDPQSWLQGGQPHHWVNAARIWIRDEQGQIKRFVQPKRHPQADEQAIPLYQGQNVLVFHSSAQADGQRLSFIVQICSDFTDAHFVRELRQEVASACAGLRIDLTFLLQMNPDQEAGHFKHAVKEYFEPPNLLVHTEDGTLLFVNNANERCGKSVEWGDSRFHFVFQRRWPEHDYPPPTYWMREDGPNNFQAVAFREKGPGIYWVHYKPHYLVSRIPGGPQLVPFSGTHALVAPIDGNRLGAGAPPNLFEAIPAVCHWLFSEWQEGRGDLGGWLKANGTKQAVANHFLDSYAAGLEEWRQAVAGHDHVARPAVNVYFDSWKGVEQHPGFPATEKEPLAWCADVNRAVKYFMNTYSLLKLGTAGFPDNNLSAHPEGVSHGISRDHILITLMWGGGQFQPQVITTRYIEARENSGVADLLCETVLLVLLQAAGRIDANQLAEQFEGGAGDVTKGDAVGGLVEAGEVVTAPIPRLRWVYAEDLIGRVNQAADPVQLEAGLADVIRKALA